MTAEPLPPTDAGTDAEPDTVGVYEAKTQLPRLLKRVEAGETITVTKHGHPIAQIVPFPGRRAVEDQDILERFREFRRRVTSKPGYTAPTDEEIKQWTHEGHRW